MSFGEAIAQGIALGVGQGANQYFLDQRRDKMDARKLQRRFDTFKKETDYAAAIQAEESKRREAYEKQRTLETRKFQTESFKQEQDLRFETAKKTAKFEFGYKDIAAKTEALTSWERAAKQSTRDLVYANAIKTSQNFLKADRAAFVRDYMAKNSGITKVEALEMGGYTLPDYSQYANNPDFADAIPKQRLAGLQDFPGMDEVFTYTPPTETDGEVEGAQWQVEQRQRRDAYSASILNNSALIQQGISEVDPMVLNQIDTSLQFGKQDALYVDSATGTEVNRVDDEVIRGLSSGRYAILDGTVMPAMKAQQIQTLQQEFDVPEDTVDVLAEPEVALPTPSSEQVRTEKIEKEETKRFRKQAKGIGDQLAKENVTGVMGAIETAEEDLKGLDEAALGYVYSALNEAQGSPRLALDAIRKAKDPKAREASMALQSLMGVLNVELKDRSGAAVTEQEAQRFFAELGRASAVGSLDETLKGLSNLRNQKLSKVEGFLQGQEQGTVDTFFASSPKYAEYFDEHETYGSDEGKGRAALRTEVRDVAAELLARDDISVDDVNAYLEEVYGEAMAAFGLELPK